LGHQGFGASGSGGQPSLSAALHLQGLWLMTG
jgi:hypothetical protein